MIQKVLQLTMAPVALALIAFAVITAPVGAHQSETSQGNDFAITATDHMSGSVCDMERDGYYVTAEWFDDEGFTVGLERDGGDSGCDEVKFHGKAHSVVICESRLGDGGCTYDDNI